MLYALLGRLVWKGAKLFLRRRYGSTYVPKSVLAGAIVVAGAAAVAVVAAARHNGDK
jgi:hypothetical protein